MTCLTCPHCRVALGWHVEGCPALRRGGRHAGARPDLRERTHALILWLSSAGLSSLHEYQGRHRKRVERAGLRWPA